MFIVSVKANKKKVVFAILCLLIVLVSILMLVKGNASYKANRDTVSSVIVENNDQRIAYLKSFGWQVAEEAVEIVDVAIPEEFNDVYNKYNKLQKEQNFDLSLYKGKRAKRYSYEVKNYPNQPNYIRANMLVYNNQIIGGDICSLKLDGFMHGFELKK